MCLLQANGVSAGAGNREVTAQCVQARSATRASLSPPAPLCQANRSRTNLELRSPCAYQMYFQLHSHLGSRSSSCSRVPILSHIRDCAMTASPLSLSDSGPAFKSPHYSPPVLGDNNKASASSSSDCSNRNNSGASETMSTCDQGEPFLLKKLPLEVRQLYYKFAMEVEGYFGWEFMWFTGYPARYRRALSPLCCVLQKLFEATTAVHLSNATFHINEDHAYDDFVAFLEGITYDRAYKALKKLKFSGLHASASVCIPHQELAHTVRCTGLVELSLFFDISRI